MSLYAISSGTSGRNRWRGTWRNAASIRGLVRSPFALSFATRFSMCESTIALLGIPGPPLPQRHTGFGIAPARGTHTPTSVDMHLTGALQTGKFFRRNHRGRLATQTFQPFAKHIVFRHIARRWRRGCLRRRCRGRVAAITGARWCRVLGRRVGRFRGDYGFIGHVIRLHYGLQIPDRCYPSGRPATAPRHRRHQPASPAAASARHRQGNGGHGRYRPIRQYTAGWFARL